MECEQDNFVKSPNLLKIGIVDQQSNLDNHMLKLIDLKSSSTMADMLYFLNSNNEAIKMIKKYYCSKL